MIDREPLRIYANKKMRDEWAYIPLLYPFWGALLKDTTPYLSLAYGTHGWDPQYFHMVEKPEEAEYIVVPHDYWWMKKNRPDLIQEYSALSEKVGVPLLVDAMSDTNGVVELPNARILRVNQYRSFLPENEITTPYAVEDLLESYCGAVLAPRQKGTVPSIGFAGFANLTPVRYGRALLKEIPVRLKSVFDRRYAAHTRGVFWRARAMSIFSRSNAVKSNFLSRPSYSGHIKTVAGNMAENRRQFVDNLLNNDYALVVRGDPNASQRLYEVLSLGRIPVIIDTDCVFPLEDIINYREFSVFIDHKDLRRAPEILAAFHKKVTPEEFVRMQERARYAYEHYLRIDSFTPYLIEMLRRSMKSGVR